MCVTIESAALGTETTRLVYVGFEETYKSEVLVFYQGDTSRRLPRISLIDMASGVSKYVVVDISRRSTVSMQDIDPAGGEIIESQKSDRFLEDEDLVLCRTSGATQFPHPEDLPVIPVEYAKFATKPFGSFDRNLVVDVPASAPRCRVAAWSDGDNRQCH